MFVVGNCLLFVMCCSLVAVVCRGVCLFVACC